jgi:5-methylcytosine-specific restriction enzyme A
MKNSGWVNYKKHPRGPNGRGLCRMCGIEVPLGRRTFCGEDCVHQYRLRNDARYASNHFKTKDKGICAICGIDTLKVRREFLKELKEAGGHWSEEGKAVLQKYKEAGWVTNRVRFFDIDHIIPVIEGGGPQDWDKEKDYTENLRLLCHVCHKEETRKLRKRLAKKCTTTKK